jgi:small subunit ribosomal protein S4
MYGVSESQFKFYYDEAAKGKGVTGESLLTLLERRLDNVVYRIGFASSRREARLLVSHGHFLVNGKKVDIPSFLVKAGDVIEVKEKSRKVTSIIGALEGMEQRGVVEWLDLDKDNMKGKIKMLPERKDITMPIEETLIVEFYSK